MTKTAAPMTSGSIWKQMTFFVDADFSWAIYFSNYITLWIL